MRNILYIGDSNVLSNSFRRFLTLKRLTDGYVHILDSGFIMKYRFFKLDYIFNVGLGLIILNLQFLFKVIFCKYDLIIVDNRNFIFSFTKWLNLNMINIITDDPFGEYGRVWNFHVRNIGMFKHVFVQREQNINELTKWGCKNVHMLYRSFDDQVHVNLGLNKEIDILFIGSYESSRCETLRFLADNGLNLVIHGNGWQNSILWKHTNVEFRQAVYLGDYVEVVNKAKINLHFLRKANRDCQDSRFFELAGCGAFILAEFSNFQASILRDGKEIVYFFDKSDLRDKILNYLSNDLLRTTIGNAAHDRIRIGHSHTDRWLHVFDVIK